MRYAIITLFSIFLAVSASAQTGIWSGTVTVGNNSLLLVFDMSDGEEATLDVPDQNALGIKASVTRGAFGKTAISIPALGARFEGLCVGEQIVGSFTQRGAELPLTLRPGKPELKRPQTPVPPFPYITEEVSFSNGNAVLKGTVSLPENSDRSTPVLLMITGSGLQNRDEEVFGHKPFAVIADELARKGIATLRYDDRGCGESSGDPVNSSVDDLMNDALAGITLLRYRFDKVGVLGHSEGGSFALLLAAEGKVDFVVSLAGAVLPMKETLLRQNREMLPKAGISQEETEEYVKLLGLAFDAVISGAPAPMADNYGISDVLKANYLPVLKQLATPYFKSSLSMNPAKVLADISCPVLALNGTLDCQVACEENLSALEKGLSTNFCCIRVQGVNHLFQNCVTGDVSEYKTIEETFSPDVLKLISLWINKLAL